MTDEISANTQAVLLLTAPLIVGGRSVPGAPTPLTAGEYDRIARRLRERGREPADLLAGADRRARDGDAPGIDPDRIDRLLERGFLLGQAVERWRGRGIWVAGRADAGYPQRLIERLGRAAPPLLYGFGSRAALEEGGLAVVGSRNVDGDGLAFAERAGRLAAGARRALISGGARGVDRAAMRAALDAGGRAVGVLADGLERAVLRRGDRELLMGGRLVLVSPYDPAARFQIWRAMDRNKSIYALADAALIVSADRGKGGTWAGAAEQRKKFRRIPVYVRPACDTEDGLRGLRELGAHIWPEPETPDALEDLLDAPPPMEDRTAGEDSVLPGLREAPAPIEADPAAALFAAALGVLARFCADEARFADEIAVALGATPLQTDDWLKRAVSRGTLEKQARPTRYRAATTEAAAGGDLSATARALVRDLCAREPQGETAIAETLGIRRGQAREWLKGMVAEGLLERRRTSGRFGAPEKPGPLFGGAGAGRQRRAIRTI